MSRTLPFPKPDRERVLLAKGLSSDEARIVVSNYMAEQEMRKRADLQIRHRGDKVLSRALTLTVEAHAEWEQAWKRELEVFARHQRIGKWMLDQTGVGPVIAAGLIAHLDNDNIPDTVGHWWSFAGLNPDQKWVKGQKRPYNAALKQLYYHLGECIKRTSNHHDSYYGPLYRAKKAEYERRNDRGGFAEKAAVYKGVSDPKNKKLLAEGKVPPAYLDRLACRWVAKIFLSHLHALLYWERKGKVPPKPFAISVLGHAHEIKVPDTEKLYPGFAKAYYGTSKRKAA
jgi:hypothetical protein